MQKLFDPKQNTYKLNHEDQIIGLFILAGQENIKSSVKFIHKDPDSNTDIKLKFILLDHAKLDLEATVVIEKGAERTDTYLKIDTLILSENANAHVVPSMEIKEDDVKGGHGATVGMLDENQIWYLKSRGLTQSEAERELIKGFVNDLISKTDDKLREIFKTEVAKLSQ